MFNLFRFSGVGSRKALKKEPYNYFQLLVSECKELTSKQKPQSQGLLSYAVSFFVNDKGVYSENKILS